MKRYLSERNLVVVFFVMAFVIFSLAQRDTKRIEKQHMSEEVVATPALAPQRNDAQVIAEKSSAPATTSHILR